MKTVNVHEAKTHLSALIARVEVGEDIQIARNGQPVVRLVRIEPPQVRQPGAWAGYQFDPAALAPMTPEEAGAEGWP